MESFNPVSVLCVIYYHSCLPQQCPRWGLGSREDDGVCYERVAALTLALATPSPSF